MNTGSGSSSGKCVRAQVGRGGHQPEVRVDNCNGDFISGALTNKYIKNNVNQIDFRKGSCSMAKEKTRGNLWSWIGLEIAG